MSDDHFVITIDIKAVRRDTKPRINQTTGRSEGVTNERVIEDLLHLVHRSDNIKDGVTKAIGHLNLEITDDLP